MLVLSTPAIYTLELTAACGQACPACSNGFAARRPPLDAAAWEGWLEEIAPQAVRIRLSGGEPTLHPQFMRILEAACTTPGLVSVFTNARWSSPGELVRKLEGLPRLAGLLVSLHGATPQSHAAFTNEAHAFEQVCANIRLAVQADIPVAISTVITRGNFRHVDEMLALALDLGAQHVAFNRMIAPPDAPGMPTAGQFRRAVRQVQALIQAGEPVRFGVDIPQCFTRNASDGCPAGTVSVTIGAWGDVRPCLYSPSVVGSLLKDDLQTIWHGPGMDAWRALGLDECQECRAISACHSGCRAMREYSPNQVDPIQGSPRRRFAPFQSIIELPAEMRPHLSARLRPEAFGYVLLGHSQAMPVDAGALPLLQACDGTLTFAQLADQYGAAGLELLGDLWQASMLEA